MRLLLGFILGLILTLIDGLYLLRLYWKKHDISFLTYIDEDELWEKGR